MTEEKRPVLSLKRKPAADTAAAGSVDTPGVVRRKKVVVVTTPPAWKLKKEKLAQAKQAAEMSGGGDEGNDFQEGADSENENEGFSDDDIDGMVDEAMSGMEKAIRLI